MTRRQGTISAGGVGTANRRWVERVTIAGLSLPLVPPVSSPFIPSYFRKSALQVGNARVVNLFVEALLEPSTACQLFFSYPQSSHLPHPHHPLDRLSRTQAAPDRYLLPPIGFHYSRARRIPRGGGVAPAPSTLLLFLLLQPVWVLDAVYSRARNSTRSHRNALSADSASSRTTTTLIAGLIADVVTDTFAERSSRLSSQKFFIQVRLGARNLGHSCSLSLLELPAGGGGVASSFLDMPSCIGLRTLSLHVRRCIPDHRRSLASGSLDTPGLGRRHSAEADW